MAFRTKLDFSDNRQVKQRIITQTVLSGGTAFGVPFSSLPTGIDLSTSAQTGSIGNFFTTFSGNSGTTIFNWVYPEMALAYSGLSAITPSNSATTQEVYGYSALTVVNIDGNIIIPTYSGVSFDFSVDSISTFGTSYTGTLLTNELIFFSANTLAFTGRTIWADISGITRTNELIITKSPQVGYVYICTDVEGKGAWGPSSGATGNVNFWSASTGNNAIAMRNSDSLTGGDYAIAMGFQTSADGNYSHAEGFATAANASSSHAEGFRATAGGDSSHAEGYETIASGDYSHAEGFATTADGSSSHTEGFQTTANGQFSHAEGFQTIANGDSSHAEGYFSEAGGYGSHAEGGSGVVGKNGGNASGIASHAEGINTIASHLASHAEGSDTRASGQFSHAEGLGSVASGSSSHAEGNNTLASGSSSHAEGNDTLASGQFSHAAGNNTIASGDSSYASGSNSHAIGFQSFIHSTNSIVTGDRSVVIGGQNITGYTDDYVFVPSLNVQTVGSGAFTNQLRIDALGNLTTNTSDGRLKKNILTLSTSLKKLNRIQGVSYQWDDVQKGGTNIRLGFIAQQIQSVEPDLVFTNKNDNYLGINSDGFIPLIVESIKELAKFVGYDKPDEVAFNFGELRPLTEEENNEVANKESNAKQEYENLLANESDEERILREENSLILKEEEGLLYLSRYKIPFFSPTDSKDESGELSSMTYDDKYLYIKTIDGWKRTNLQNF
tara:strand:- start:14124 stop:16301 length:2178 start_codon:yes stop_codon:yes gene_type:complete